jgi:uncharacterized RDD family membrane protein YckC
LTGELAGIPERLAARLVDLALLFGPALVAAAHIGDVALGFATYLVLGLAGFIQDLAGTAVRGQSLGKWLMRIRVVRQEDGRPPGWERAFLRSWAGFFPIGVLTAAWDARRQGVHDRWAGTLVVRT